MGNVFCPPEKLSKNQQRKQRRLAKTQTPEKLALAEKWNKTVAQFTSTLLDESFEPSPVRASTVEAAAEYACSDNTCMPGRHKHLGGAYDPVDGCIYGVPANSKAILALVPNWRGRYKLTTIALPESIRGQKMKWLRGIITKEGYLWAIPSWATHVLCVDLAAWRGRRPVTENGVVQLIPLPEQHERSEWQWHGAGQVGKFLYCIPSNAKYVLKVDTAAKTTSLLPIDATGYSSYDPSLANKWYGGIVGADGCVYGIPYRAPAVLRIEENRASLIGPEYGVARYLWHGGIQVNGKIYAHPSHADTVLVIDTTSGAPNVYELMIDRQQGEGGSQTYKWLGGSVGADGTTIYCPACDTTAVLRIDTVSEKCSTFGYAGDSANKWQGGVRARDGCIYCIPADGQHVLRISTEHNVVQLLGKLPGHKDKWQGGNEGLNGALYFIPENGYRVLKVTPAESPPSLIDGKLPTGDVKLEYI